MIQANNNSHRASHTRTDLKEKFTDGFAVITAELIQSGIWSKLEDRHRNVMTCVLSHFPNMWPGLKRLTMLSGYSKSTVVRALNEMDHMGLLSKESRYTDRGDQDTNRYTLAEMKNPETVKGILKYLDHDQFLQLTNNLYAGGKHDIDKDVIELLSPQGVVSDMVNHGGVRSNKQRVVSDEVVTKKQSIRNKNKEHAGIDFVLDADCLSNPADKSSSVQATESQPNPSTDSLSTTTCDSPTVSSDKCNSVPAKENSTDTISQGLSTQADKSSTISQTDTAPPPKSTEEKMLEALKRSRESSKGASRLDCTISPDTSNCDTSPSREEGVGESYIDPDDGSKIYLHTELPHQIRGDYALKTPKGIYQAQLDNWAAIYQENKGHFREHPEYRMIELILQDEAQIAGDNLFLAANLVCSNGYGLEELRALISDTKKKADRCPQGLLMKRLQDGDRLTVIEGYDESIPAHRDTMECAKSWMEERDIVSGGQRKLLSSHLMTLVELQHYKYWANDMLEYFCSEYCLENTAPPGVVVAKLRDHLGEFLQENLEGAKVHATYMANETESALTN